MIVVMQFGNQPIELGCNNILAFYMFNSVVKLVRITNYDQF